MTRERVPNHGHTGFDDGGKLRLTAASDAGTTSETGGSGTGPGGGTALLPVQEDGAPVLDASVLDAGHGLDVVDEGGGVAGWAVDETELDGSLIPGVETDVGGPGEGAYTVEVQAPKSRHFLMRDGTWADPLLVGTGDLTVGAISSVVDYTGDPDYVAWPSVCRMRNGQLLMGYTRGNAHHLDNSGYAVCKIGTEYPDGTITWGSEITIYDDPSLWVSLMAVGISHSGRVFATLFRDNAGAGGTGEAAVVYSDDFGLTWTTWSTLSTSFTSDAFGAGPVVELPDGDLLVTIEGRSSPTSLANRSSHLLRSTDDGATWGSETTIRDYATDSRPYYETRIVLLDDDTLLAVHRTSGGTGTHYISVSTDNGLTWAAPYSAYDGYSASNVIQLSTGTLIAGTRRNSDASAIAYTSIDRGATWQGPVVLDATMNEMEYACPVELFDGRILVVYGYQPTSSTSNSDIKQVYVTEDTLDVRDAITVTAADVSITDAGGYFSGTDVEAALQEVGALLASSGATTHYEVVMMPGITNPPNPVLTPDGDAWVYGLVTT